MVLQNCHRAARLEHQSSIYNIAYHVAHLWSIICITHICILLDFVIYSGESKCKLASNVVFERILNTRRDGNYGTQ